MWTIADVFHFEAARYYDIKTYVAYQVTVKLEGRSRTYRALALFHEPRPECAPEFWDAIVNGVGDVWKEKRPAYKTKTRRRSESLERLLCTTAFSYGRSAISDVERPSGRSETATYRHQFH